MMLKKMPELNACESASVSVSVPGWVRAEFLPPTTPAVVLHLFPIAFESMNHAANQPIVQPPDVEQPD